MPQFPDKISLHHPDKQSVLEALNGDLIRRMRNWVDWRGGTSVSCASSFILDYGTGYDRYREARMPVLVAEAEQTDRAVRSLPDELGTPVALFWLGGEDLSFREMAVHCACSDKTVKARILRGHALLMAYIFERPVQAIGCT